MKVAKYSFVYIDPLKTGSQTLDKFFRRMGGKHLVYDSNLDKHRRYITEPELQSWNLCASVRNPYTRAYSLWNMDRTKKITHHGIRLDSFENYMEDIIDLCEKNPDSDSLNVYRYYSCNQYLKPFDIPDKFIIKMETMKADLERLGFNTGRSLPIRNIGKYNGIKSRKDAESPAFIDLVNQWAGSDFKKYGYDKL